jgi:hypothetical protein
MGLLSFVGGFGAEEKKSITTLEMLRGVQIGPRTAALAERANFVLQGVATAKDEIPARPGDQVTALVVLTSMTGKTPTSMWMIRLQLRAAAAARSNDREVTRYTNTGAKFTFRSSQSPMLLETLGPILKDTDPVQPLPVRTAKLSVATDYLGLDLLRTANVIAKIKLSATKTGFTLTTREKPFPANEIKLQKPRADALGLTEDDLRSFSGALPALIEFLRIIQRTPDLQSILYQVIEKPSVFDVLAHGGDSSLHFQYLGGGNSAGQEIFWPDDPKHEFGLLLFNLEIFGKPILTVALHVAPPRPPLEVCAGIVGIAAWAPEKPDKVIIVRVMSATAGPPP